MPNYTPTMVIGIGQAGARQVSKINEIFEQEGGEADLLPIAIDSKNDDIEKDAPEIDYHTLDHPVEDLSKELPERSYLRGDEKLPQEGGAMKNRAVGRLYLDSEENFGPTKAFINKKLDEFLSQQEHRRTKNINVWIVNGLGGGTGSGVFPLLTLMVRDICDGFEPAVSLRGVGTVPELELDKITDEGKFRLKRPDGSVEHHINAFTALCELQGLLGEEYPAMDDTLRIDLESEPVEEQYNFYEEELPILEDYYLIGFDEGEGGRARYRRKVNTKVTRLIYYMSVLEAAEDYMEGLQTESKLKTLDGAQLKFPVSDIEEYFNYDRRETQQENLISKIDKQLEQLKTDYDLVGEIKSFAVTENAESDSELVRATVRKVQKIGVDNFEMRHTDKLEQVKSDARDAAKHIVNEELSSGYQEKFTLSHIDISEQDVTELDEYETGKDILDGTERGTSSAESQPGPQSLWKDLSEFTAVDVVEFVFYDQLLPRIDEDIENKRREYQEIVQECWKKYKDDFRDERPNQFKNFRGGNVPKKAKGLIEFLDWWETEKRGDDSLFGDIISRGPDPDELHDDREEIKATREKYESKRNDRIEIEELRRDRNRYLSRLREKIEEAGDSLRDRKTELEGNLTGTSHQRERVEEQLKEQAIQEFATMRINNLSPVTEDEFYKIRDNEREIGALVSSNILDEEDLKQDISYLLDEEIGEPLEDLDSENGEKPKELLSILYSERNQNDSNDWYGLISHQAEMGNIKNVSNKSGTIRDNLRFFFLCVYTNIDMHNMTEFESFRQTLDTERTISELLMNVDKNEINDHLQFAYPSLVNQDIKKNADQTATQQLD